ncbi:MAG: hypothetical protein HFF39_09560 [Lawsonibacter sp.]|nr:hypothetical protein [Lawsonibacter sp.]
MSWNDFLYFYSLERGGTFFGQDPGNSWAAGSDWNASLLLEHRGEPMVVTCNVISSGRYGTAWGARVLLRCTLPRAYSLTVTPKSTARQGVNMVLNQLDRGAERLGMDLVKETHFEELKGRGVKSSDPAFTKLVLGNLELRHALGGAPKYGLRVDRCAPSYAAGEDPSHLIAAHAALADWELGPVDAWLNAEAQRAEIAGRNLVPRLDALVELARLAHGAVTAWPMPET